MNHGKLEEISNSYLNGQKKQMCNQIKEYGVKKFFVDFYDHAYSSDEYTEIVYTFFLVKDL